MASASAVPTLVQLQQRFQWLLEEYIIACSSCSLCFAFSAICYFIVAICYMLYAIGYMHYAICHMLYAMCQQWSRGRAHANGEAAAKADANGEAAAGAHASPMRFLQPALLQAREICSKM